MAAAPAQVCWTIYQGRTFRYTVRPEMLPIVYKPITGIQQSAPVSITAVGHGLVSGWNAAVTNVKGMTQINATPNALRPSDFRPVTFVDADTVTINSIDAAGFSPYVSGGHLIYYTPVSLAGAVARLDIRDKVGGVLLHSLTSVGGDIVIDDTNHFVGIEIPPTTSDDFAFLTAVGDLEVEYADSSVDALVIAEIAVIREITTSG